MGNEQALAIIDDCKVRLQEIGITEILITTLNGENDVSIVYNGNPMKLAYLANTALMEVLIESVSIRNMEIEKDGR